MLSEPQQLAAQHNISQATSVPNLQQHGAMSYSYGPTVVYPVSAFSMGEPFGFEAKENYSGLTQAMHAVPAKVRPGAARGLEWDPNTLRGLTGSFAAAGVLRCVRGGQLWQGDAAGIAGLKALAQPSPPSLRPKLTPHVLRAHRPPPRPAVCPWRRSNKTQHPQRSRPLASAQAVSTPHQAADTLADVAYRRPQPSLAVQVSCLPLSSLSSGRTLMLRTRTTPWPAASMHGRSLSTSTALR